MTPLQLLSRDLAHLVARAAPGVVGVELRRGQGSGVVLSPDGYVLPFELASVLLVAALVGAVYVAFNRK